MKAGFALIEVLLSAAIAAILSLMLFGVLDQVNRLTFWTNGMINRTITGVAVCNQFERDISGAFVPTNVDKEQAIFECTEKEGILQTLTFVTTNTLFTHRGCARRMVRVMYRLIEDKKQKQERESGKKIYHLTRQESDTFDPKAFELKSKNPIRSYVVARGLVRCGITFVAATTDKEGKTTMKKSPIWPEKKEGVQQKAPEQPSKTPEEQKQNNKTPEQQNKKGEEEPDIQLPILAQINIALDAGTRKRPVPFSVSVVIPAAEIKQEKPKEEQEQKPKTAETTSKEKPATPQPAQPTPSEGGLAKNNITPIVATEKTQIVSAEISDQLLALAQKVIK